MTFVAMSGSFLTLLDSTIVNVSLSSLARELHSDLSTIQWISSGYLLAMALALPLSGWLVDRIGAKLLYLLCFSAFAASSAMCGLAWSASSLIGFRVVQGISGGLLAPMTQMMMARAAGDQMARVMGYAAMPVLLAPILGPVIAGFILEHASWRWLFLINIPFGVLAIACAAVFLPDDSDERRLKRFDFLGFALLSPGLVLFLHSVDRLGAVGARIGFASSLCLFAAFVANARRKAENALINLELFRKKDFSAAVVTQFLSNGVVFAGQMLIPFFLVRSCGLSPSKTGLMLIPLGAGMMCSYPWLGNLTDRLGIRSVSAGGALLSALTCGPLVYLACSGFDLAILVPTLFLRGVGMSMIGIPSVSAAYSSIKREDMPMASTTLNVVQRLGGPFLTTACAIFLDWRVGLTAGDRAGHAFAQTFLFLGGIQMMLFLAALRLPLRAAHDPAGRQDIADLA
ncbi:DHA2 family efflux MFS transporter permease subunit [Sphingomonas oligophenolica]|uniref:DHA2 family efflux MFS transporter permease subunit n=1 Tax=Sphingomonas oligophenolica TaxID=301154 RepID=A0ABU9YB33_9SPHN